MTSDELCVLAADYGRYNQPGYQQIAKYFSMAADKIDRLNVIIDGYAAGFDTQHAEIDRLTKRVAELRSVLQELHGMVWGECPSLLNEDSGGSAHLDVRINAALAVEEQTHAH
jgi:hypothetical protein